MKLSPKAIKWLESSFLHRYFCVSIYGRGRRVVQVSSHSGFVYLAESLYLGMPRRFRSKSSTSSEELLDTLGPLGRRRHNAYGAGSTRIAYTEWPGSTYQVDSFYSLDGHDVAPCETKVIEK